MSDDHDIRACGVCGRVLQYNRLIDGWEHGLVDSPADHPAVPIPVEELGEQLQARCDFCEAEAPTHVLPVASFALPYFPEHRSVSGWAACPQCATLIERNEWNALVRRVMHEIELRNGPMNPEVEASLRVLYRKVRRNITGALRES